MNEAGLCRCPAVGRPEEERRAEGERKREQKEQGRKLKTFLGLVSNLLLLSSHQRENSLR